MAIFLVQHGKSLPKDLDPEQNLSEEGITDVEGMGFVLMQHKVNVTSIMHSGKKRARQTAEIFNIALKPPGGVDIHSGLGANGDVTAFADSLNAKKNIMYIGHLPFMERLASYLITKSIDTPVVKFQNGGVVCLDYETKSRSWFIKWTLMPQID